MNSYLEKLSEAKAKYPFANWEKYSMEAYTAESCGACAATFDQLIAELAALGPDAPEEEKLECFYRAVKTLNTLDEEYSDLIETGEREELCELCNIIATSAGLDPAEYGDGEGPATEWRNW